MSAIALQPIGHFGFSPWAKAFYVTKPPQKRIVQRSHQVAEAACQEVWEEYVTRVANDRCRDSFMKLFDHFAPRINTYLQKQGASAATAEELSQEALLSLWRKADRYDPSKAAVSTWLFRVARNLMIDSFRRERGIAYETEDAALELAQDDDAPAAADAETVRKLITTLPEAQAETLYKHFFEGKSHNDIAEETGQPLGSVKSRIRRALIALREKMEVETP